MFLDDLNAEFVDTGFAVPTIMHGVCETENLMQRPPAVHELHLPETHAHNLKYACKKQHSSEVLPLKVETAIFEGTRPTS
jgi:hypothetical protein